MFLRFRPTLVRTCILTATALAATASHAAAAGGDVVLYTSDVTAVSGNFAAASSASAAGGQQMQSQDYGWSTPNSPLAYPNDYFEVTFTAPAYVKYHVWLRLRAQNDSKWNDSVWVQFSDALDASGNSIYQINSTNGLAVNLESCSGCGDSGWGWQDGAYWLSQNNVVQFPSSGTHRIRVQTREDGVAVDQIVLSASNYMYSAPGSVLNDSTILPESNNAGTSGGSSSSDSSGGSSSSASGGGSNGLAWGGSPAAVPGTIGAQNFDTGGPGVSYGDSTPGNAGGAYRQTDVDLESSSEGAYDIGWIAPGEWVNYTVNVASAGSYVVQLRVAGYGGSLHLGFNSASNVWTTVSVPSTGAWQSWTTVSVPVTLGAGVQQMTLLFDTGGFNFEYANIVSGSGGGTTTVVPPSPPSPPAAPSGAGTPVIAVAWNVQVDDSSSSHAQTAIDYLMNLSPQPQIVILEEAHQSQYNTYVSELRARTGQSWNGVMLTHCPPGAWNGSSCSGSEDEGVAVFSSFPVVDSGTQYLPYADAYHSARASVRLAVNINGVVTQVFGAHLQVGNASARYSSMAVLKNWASGYSAPQIVGGDFNADMDQIDTYSGMLPNFIDSWSVAGSGSGFTASTPYPTMKLDYLFSDSSGRAQTNWTYVATSTWTVSDHFPIVTQFTVQ
jgi:endonuclease/exonuclease/phosphatase family metal-dependent hydrolase